MIEVIDVVLGAALTAGAHAIGFLRGRRRGTADPEPICGCGHHYSQHDPETGACHEYVNKGKATDYGSVQCPCRRYTGPEPLPRYIP